MRKLNTRCSLAHVQCLNSTSRGLCSISRGLYATDFRKLSYCLSALAKTADPTELYSRAPTFVSSPAYNPRRRLYGCMSQHPIWKKEEKRIPGFKAWLDVDQNIKHVIRAQRKCLWSLIKTTGTQNLVSLCFSCTFQRIFFRLYGPGQLLTLFRSGLPPVLFV